MIISDLAYLETITAAPPISGGASLAVAAVAIAVGDNAYALTDTSTQLRTVGKGKVTLAKGKGTAIAIGSSPYADVSYWADGFDKVIVKSRSKQGENYAYDYIKVKALDLPF